MKNKENKIHSFQFIEETHQYILDGIIIPSVTQILGAEGFYSGLDKINQTILERARKYGLALHKACELNDNKMLDINSLSKPLVKPLENWNKFINDFKVKFILIEEPSYSPTYKFGFTPDRIGYIDGKLTIIDIKSTAEVGLVNGIQLGGYQLGFEDMSKLRVKQRWVVKLTEEKYEIIKFENHVIDKLVFGGALTCHKWKKENL